VSSPAGLALGFAADFVLGDPRRGHPVAMFGRGAGALERQMWRPSRVTGAAYAVAGVGAAAALGAVLDRLARTRWSRIALTAVAGWSVIGGRSLHREASRVGAALEAGDLAKARAGLPALVGRDPSALDGDEIARAVVE
jgi:adenosylcobinamide-phosphate synthase